MQALTSRQRQLLRAITLEHIASAAPVGSDHISRRHNLGASAATIRNEMNVLEAMGLIKQPHTSAGRVPTARGYRFFVDTLLGDADLSPDEKGLIRGQFQQVELDTQRWYELTATLLARYVGLLALVSPPHPSTSRLKHLELVGINEGLALLVVVLQDGNVVQHLVAPGDVPVQHELRATSNRLNAMFAGKSVASIQSVTDDVSAFEKHVIDTLLKILRQVDEGSSRPASVAGVANVLAQPEFARLERVRDLVEMAESGELLHQLQPLAPASGLVTTVIGDEMPIEGLQDTGVVLTRAGAPDDVGGLLALLGPTRMPYFRAISLLHYMRTILDDLQHELQRGARAN